AYLSQPLGKLSGKFCGVAGHVEELRRQTAQLIERKHIAGNSVCDPGIASTPDQSEADFVPVTEKPLAWQNPFRKFLNGLVRAKHPNRFSLFNPARMRSLRQLCSQA